MSLSVWAVEIATRVIPVFPVLIRHTQSACQSLAQQYSEAERNARVAPPDVVHGGFLRSVNPHSASGVLAGLYIFVAFYVAWHSVAMHSGTQGARVFSEVLLTQRMPHASAAFLWRLIPFSRCCWEKNFTLVSAASTMHTMNRQPKSHKIETTR